MESARRFIAQDNPRAAEATANRVRTAVDRLREVANMGPNMGREGRLPGTRELVVPRTPFVVAYRVVGGEVRVPAIVHARRAWPPPP